MNRRDLFKAAIAAAATPLLPGLDAEQESIVGKMIVGTVQRCFRDATVSVLDEHGNYHKADLWFMFNEGQRPWPGQRVIVTKLVPEGFTRVICWEGMPI